jgi:hypothetical protein
LQEEFPKNFLWMMELSPSDHAALVKYVGYRVSLSLPGNASAQGHLYTFDPVAKLLILVRVFESGNPFFTPRLTSTHSSGSCRKPTWERIAKRRW